MAVIIGIGKSAGNGSATASVPLDALSQDGVPPEQGDKVSFSVDATVQSVSGSSATLKIDAVDGQPIKASGGGTSADQGTADEGSADLGPPPPGGPPEGTAAMGKRLRKKARGQPMPLM